MNSKILVTAVLAFLMIGIVPAYAAYGSDTGGMMGQKVMKKDMKKDITFREGAFKGREARDRIRDHMKERRVEMKDLRDGFKDLRKEYSADLKDLAKKWRMCSQNHECDRDHFPYGKYQSALSEYLNTLKQMLRYMNEVNPTEPATGEAIKAVEDAISKIESLPKEPTEDQFAEIKATLEQVRNLVERLKSATHEMSDAHREAGFEHAQQRIEEVVSKLREQGVADTELQTCRSKLSDVEDETRTSDVRKAIVHDVVDCLRGLLRPNTE